VVIVALSFLLPGDPDGTLSTVGPMRRAHRASCTARPKGNTMTDLNTTTDTTPITACEHCATKAPVFAASPVGHDLDVKNSPLRKLFLNRAAWLILLTLFGVVTSTLVAAQEDILTSALVLAAFLAPIIDMGGNTGSQAATLVIRSMAVNTVSAGWRDVWFIIRRELIVASCLGATVAVIEVALAFFVKSVDLDVMIIVGGTMLIVTVIGGLLGAVLPFAARAVRIDPATLSAPLITSIMDLVGVTIYFSIAALVLSDKLV
jgi:magnesium transporter